MCRCVFNFVYEWNFFFEMGRFKEMLGSVFPFDISDSIVDKMERVAPSLETNGENMDHIGKVRKT